MPPRAKHAVLVVLVLVNVALLCTVLASAVQLPRAHAQPAAAGGLSDQYLAVAGQIQSAFDAVYVLDSVEERLYVYVPVRSGTSSALEARSSRDLEADFSRQPRPVVPPRRR